MLSSYFIEINTGQDYARADYDQAAGRLAALLVSVLSDRETMDTLTHMAPRETCSSEIEISLEDSQLLGRAVVDIVSSERVKLDKGALTKLFRNHEISKAWPGMRVAKRHVPAVQETFFEPVEA